MPLTIVEHPLAKSYLTTLRDRSTDTPRFREAARRLAYFLVAEATSDLGVEEFEVETPLEGAVGHRPAKPASDCEPRDERVL